VEQYDVTDVLVVNHAVFFILFHNTYDDVQLYKSKGARWRGEHKLTVLTTFALQPGHLRVDFRHVIPEINLSGDDLLILLPIPPLLFPAHWIVQDSRRRRKMRVLVEREKTSPAAELSRLLAPECRTI
jgi:hypothetical protein